MREAVIVSYARTGLAKSGRGGFNITPPIVPNSLTEPYTASSPFYDVLGTTWAVGFRFNL